MAVHPLTPSPLARDIPFNPVACSSPLDCGNPAVQVFEAVVPDTASTTGRIHRTVCEDIRCLHWAQVDADEYNPIDTDLRWATARELSELSGLEIPVAA